MPARVVVLGLDAAEAGLVERWSREGRTPFLARMAETASRVTESDEDRYLPADAIWPEITTGRPIGSIGWWRVPNQIFAGEGRMRPIRRDDLERIDLTAFWQRASAAGRRVAVVDVPWAPPSPGIGGVHLRGWGTHDQPFGTGTDPPDALEEIRRRYGDYPLPHHGEITARCDKHEDSRDSYLLLLRRLFDGARLRARLVRDLLDEGDWDLLVAVFGEGHCAGHHLWHFHDPLSPWHDPSAPEALQRGLADVYACLDECLAHVLDGIGDDTTVVLFLSSGMGPARGGWQLLPDVVARLGLGPGSQAAARARTRVPAPVRRVLRSALAGRARTRLRHVSGSGGHPFETTATRAAAVPNSPYGAIRLNVRGRDPFGSVEPGSEYDALCDEIASELEALEDLDTGTRPVRSVARADALFGPERHANLPDLLVRFRDDGPPILRVHSERVGAVSRPLRTPGLHRSGDHTLHARMWIREPGAGARVESDGGLLGLAPTVLRLLDVDGPPALR